ncbi:MAG TPA: hypothetical protein VH306_13960 [Gaiellaceae bacterium]|jgi:hypothetical protein
MPSRKQRRRRSKLQRHEYEYVIETDEGEEVVESIRDVEPVEDTRPAPNGKAARPKSKAGRGSVKGPVDRRGRPVPKPSWQRVGKRALIFMPFFVLFFFIAAPSLTLTQKIFQAVLLAGVFIPASYLADRMVYRMAVRRMEQGKQPAGRTRK